MQFNFCSSDLFRSRLLCQLFKLQHVLMVVTGLCIFSNSSLCQAQALERWVYVSANFLLPAEVDRVEKLMKE